jgi:DNA-directed RNA polymerase specialized sigma24 family protein
MTTTTDLSGISSRPGQQGLTPGDLAELYAAHRLSLVRLALLLVDDRASAEDVVQDAFASLAGRLHRVREPHAALGYLRTSVVNGSRSTLRLGLGRGHVAPRRPGRGAPRGARRARPAGAAPA